MANVIISIPGNTPICNPSNGILNQEWRLWFNKLYQRTGGSDAPGNADIAVIGELVSANTAGIEALNTQVDGIVGDLSQINTSIDLANDAIESNAQAIQLLDGEALKSIANVGSGAGVYKERVASEAKLKSLVAGANIFFDVANPDQITISAQTGSLPSFGNLTVHGSLIGAGTSATTFLTATGGEYWTLARFINPATAISVPDYSSVLALGDLTASSVYYVYFDFYTNQIQARKVPGAWNFNANAKLLWVVKTDATKISSVIDYRGMDVMLMPRTYMGVALLSSGATSYDFTVPLLSTMNQKPTSDELSPAYLAKYSRWEANLFCITGEHGHLPGDEVSLITGDGAMMGPPQIRVAGGVVYVMQGAETRIMNYTTKAWSTPTAGSWAMVLKVSFEYH